jgi:hypothetical protein
MTLTAFPNGISSFGMPVIGAGPVLTTGNVFFVSSTSTGASNGNLGTAPDRPLSTIDAAVGKCTANNGDHIIVMPGHVETVTAAGGLALDVAGITLIGIGNGASRPQINFTTAVGADMDIGAASVTMVNFLFTGGIDALTGPIDINAADCTLLNIETRDVTGQATDFIVTDANCNRLHISGWKHSGATAAGADTAISIVGGDSIIIEDFDIFGNFAVAAIENVTTASTNLRIGGGHGQNFIQNGLDNAAVVAITLVATSTGHVGPNINARIGVDATSNTTNITEAFVGAAMQFFQPLNVCNLGGEVAMQTNITASTDA